MGRTGKKSQREAKFHTGPVASEKTLPPWALLTGSWTVSWCSAERTPWRGATSSTLVGIESHRQSRQMPGEKIRPGGQGGRRKRQRTMRQMSHGGGGKRPQEKMHDPCVCPASHIRGGGGETGSRSRCLQTPTMLRLGCKLHTPAHCCWRATVQNPI